MFIHIFVHKLWISPENSSLQDLSKNDCARWSATHIHAVELELPM